MQSDACGKMIEQNFGKLEQICDKYNSRLQ